MKPFNKHSFWTVLLVIMLAVVMMLTLAACGEDGQTGETTSVSQYKSKGNYTTINGDKLSWELLNSVPIRTPNMDIEEARKLCVDFFRVSKSALWIPDSNYEAYDASGNVIRSMEEGIIYGGLPYITLSHGNIYRLMDYMDPETGVVDVTSAGRNQNLFGNQCSFASYWGWGRVINSPNFGWTQNMTQANGFLRLGSYTYADNLTGFSDAYGTPHIISENGAETMYESYALLKAGDGIVYYTTAGHVVMIAQDAHVEYGPDGKIDPAKSYVIIIDQAGTWTNGQNEEGDSFVYAANNDAKWTFLYLKERNYIPFTFAEWLGTDPIEETEISYSHTGDTISMDQLYGSKVTCNYGIADIYAIIRDNKGNEVYKLAGRADFVNKKELAFSKTSADNGVWGSLDDLKKGKKYTVEIIAQISTGERPTLWTGTLEH